MVSLMTAYHKWLIRRRIYCELCLALTEGKAVVKFKGRDTVVCSHHTDNITNEEPLNEEQLFHGYATNEEQKNDKRTN